MEILQRNKPLISRTLKLFEVGYVVSPDQGSEVDVKEDLVLSYVISGPEITLTDGLSTLKALMTNLGIEYALRQCTLPSGLPERTACVVRNSKDVGFVMELLPDVIVSFELEYPVVVAEIKLNELLKE
jgi:phenylalanyl-tRNA synthetase beta chain